MSEQSETTIEANDNASILARTISLADLAKSLGRDEDDLVRQLTAILARRKAMHEVMRLAREMISTADLSEPRGVVTAVSSDRLAELMEALEDAENHG